MTDVRQPSFAFQIIGPLSDAVSWARSLHKSLPELWKGEEVGIDVMGTYYAEVLRRLQTVDRGARVDVFSFDAPSTVHSFIIREIDRETNSQVATILIPNAANFCWSRFAACKELCHLITDTESKHYCEDILKQLRNAAQRPGSEDVKQASSFGQLNLPSEHFCYFFALELMVPWDERRELGRTAFAGQTCKATAQKFRVPEAVIEHAIATGYFELSFTINTYLDDTAGTGAI